MPIVGSISVFTDVSSWDKGGYVTVSSFQIQNTGFFFLFVQKAKLQVVIDLTRSLILSNLSFFQRVLVFVVVVTLKLPPFTPTKEIFFICFTLLSLLFVLITSSFIGYLHSHPQLTGPLTEGNAAPPSGSCSQLPSMKRLLLYANSSLLLEKGLNNCQTVSLLCNTSSVAGSEG